MHNFANFYFVELGNRKTEGKMDISPDSILYAVLAFSWVEYLWEAYIGSRYISEYFGFGVTLQYIK